MKRNAVVRSIIFFIILAVVIGGLSYVLRKKESWRYKYQFLNSGQDYDALFFGTSHVHEGIDPIVLWEDYGIRSYNLGSSGESVQMTYYVVREALETAHPKAIFVDYYKIVDTEEFDQTYSFVHESIDAFPLNKIKLEAIDYATGFLDQSRFSFISSLYAYHVRYGELKREDFLNDYTLDKGAYIMTSILPAEKPVLTGTTEKVELKGGNGVRAYEKILKLCSEKGIKCVLMGVPMKNGRFNEEYFNALKDLTLKNGGYTLEGNSHVDQIGLDYAYDFSDSESHLNLLGAKKFTDYIGAFLRDELGFEDYRSDSAIADVWNADSHGWSLQKVDMLKKRQDAVSYIFQAYDPLYEVKVYVYDPELTDRQYGLSYCLDKMGIEPVVDDGEMLGGSAFDMRVRVLYRDTGEQAAEQYFMFDESRNIFKTNEMD